MTTPDGDAEAAARIWGRWFDVGALSVLVLAALCVGALVNGFRAHPLPWIYADRRETMNAAVTSVSADQSPAGGSIKTSEPPHEISLEQFHEFVTAQRGLVLDARPKVFYTQAHVPGAVSLPRETFAGDYKALRGQVEAFKNQPIAVYCSGADCPDSQLLADALTSLGYHHLLIYTSGWEEWSQAGLPQEGTAVQP